MARARAGRGRTRIWVTIGLVAFVLLDVGLVLMALGAGRPTAPIAQRSTPAPVSPPSSSAPAEPTPTPREPATALPVTRLLAAADTSIAWRAPIADCGPDPLVLQTTVDGGVTWTDQPLARYDVRRVLALSVAPGGEYGQGIFAVGDDCRVTAMRSFTEGRFWEVEESLLPDFSYLDPYDPASVVIAGLATPAPCPDAVQLVVAAGLPTVLCADGSVFALADADPADPEANWAAVGRSPGALALVAGAAEVLVATGEQEQCAAIALQPVPSAGAPVCTQQTGAPGAIVVAAAGTSHWLWAGDTVAVLA